MTAKTKHGFKGHATRGADPGTPHERLTRAHKRPGRAEGAALGLNAHGPGPIDESAPASPYQMSGPETDGELPGMPGAGGAGPPDAAVSQAGGQPAGDAGEFGD